MMVHYKRSQQSKDRTLRMKRARVYKEALREGKDKSMSRSAATAPPGVR